MPKISESSVKKAKVKAKKVVSSIKKPTKTIKKVTEDIEKLSLNTVISTFMIAVNEWTKQNCSSKEVLSSFLVLLSPFAPHIAEELWLKIGNNKSISNEKWPNFKEKYFKQT